MPTPNPTDPIVDLHLATIATRTAVTAASTTPIVVGVVTRPWKRPVSRLFWRGNEPIGLMIPAASSVVPS